MGSSYITMRAHRPMLCLAGAAMLLGSVFFFQISYTLLIEYMATVSSYKDDVQDSKLVFRIAVSSLGIVFGVWAIVIGLIPDRARSDN